MFGKLHNSFQQFIITTVIAFLGIVIAAFQPFYFQEKKELTVISAGSTPLVSNTVDITSKFSISFNGKSVEQPVLFTIQIQNTGNKEIRTEDYTQPITVIFNQDIEVLEAFVNVGWIAVNKFDTSVKLSDALINPGDSFTLSVVLNNKSKTTLVQYNVQGRIAGVGKIKNTTHSEPLRPEAYFYLSGVVTLFLLSLLFTWMGPVFNNPERFTSYKKYTFWHNVDVAISFLAWSFIYLVASYILSLFR